jgi:hypothetical protein
MLGSKEFKMLFDALTVDADDQAKQQMQSFAESCEASICSILGVQRSDIWQVLDQFEEEDHDA